MAGNRRFPLAGKAAHSIAAILSGGKMNRIIDPEPITVDPHYSPQFYAELFGLSPSTILRWFQDMNGVLKLSKPAKNGRRTRVELRIPYSLAMAEYRRRTQR
jgi:hypothetical protein